MAGDEGVPRRTHAGAREEGRSGAQFRLGSSRGASVGGGEAYGAMCRRRSRPRRAVHGEGRRCSSEKTWSGSVKRRRHQELFGVALCPREEGLGAGNWTMEARGGRIALGGAHGRRTAMAACSLGSRRKWDGTEGVGAVRCERGSGECSACACVVQEERPALSGRGKRQGRQGNRRRPMARRPRGRTEATEAMIGRSNQRELMRAG